MAVFIYINVVIIMIENVEMFALLLLLFICTFCIFNVRKIVSGRVSTNVENKVISILKLICYVLCIVVLILIYYIRR